MKKPFNLRLPVLYASALAAGIVYAALLAYFGLSGVYILVAAACFFVGCVIFAIIARRVSSTFILLAAVLLFVAGAVYLYAVYFAFNYSDSGFYAPVKVCGIMRESGKTSNGKTFIVIDRVTADGRKLNGKLVAYLSENAGEYCRRGYGVSFTATIAKEKFIIQGSISYNAVRNVRYSCTVDGGLTSTYGFSLFGEIAYAVENALYGNLSPETAAVCSAMLTGDSQAISEGTLSAFRYGGVAHVFAVSGLHIGVIYGALSLVFRKTGVNRFVAAAIKIIFIILYAGVCGFSSSSVRAVVMCSVAAVSNCLRRKYDGWNALALSALIILLINPLALFEVGFILSFGAMTGIMLLSNRLKRLFSFLPRKVAGGLAVGWSAQFAMTPSLLSCFGYLSVAGLFLNVVFVPVISVLYTLLFACTFISVIFPFAAGVVLPVAGVPLGLITNLIVEAGFENAIITASYGHLAYLPFIALTVALSDKFNLKILYRAATVFFTCLVCALCLISAQSRTSVVFGTGGGGAYALITREEGTVLVVTDGYIGDAPEADSLVILGGEENLSPLFNTGRQYESVYIRGSAINIPSFGGMELIYADSFTACGVDFRFDGDVLYVSAEGVDFAVINAESGDLYGEMPTNTAVNLYNYGSGGAVLYAGGQSYGLATCGDMGYVLSGGRVIPSYAVPKE